MTIQKISIRHAPLSDRIVLARFGRDPEVALETKDAMDDFFKAIISFSFNGNLPEPGDKRAVDFGGGDEQFVMTVERKPT